jgi:hypothetical protein
MLAILYCDAAVFEMLYCDIVVVNSVPLLLLDDPLVDADGLDIRLVLDGHNHIHGVPVVHVFPHLQNTQGLYNYSIQVEFKRLKIDRTGGWKIH